MTNAPGNHAWRDSPPQRGERIGMTDNALLSVVPMWIRRARSQQGIECRYSLGLRLAGDGNDSPGSPFSVSSDTANTTTQARSSQKNTPRGSMTGTKGLKSTAIATNPAAQNFFEDAAACVATARAPRLISTSINSFTPAGGTHIAATSNESAEAIFMNTVVIMHLLSSGVGDDPLPERNGERIPPSMNLRS